MEEELQMFLDDTKENMINALKHLEKELLKIRAGKASINMLDGVYVDYYGTNSPISQVANIGITDARTLVIQPWDKTMIEPIEKAIMKANIGVTPINNGELIRIVVPALTEERRKEIVKQVKNEGENAKIAIRNIRKDTNNEIKRMKKEGLSEDSAKGGEEDVQKLTDEYIKKTDQIVEAKEKSVLTI